MNFCLKKKKHLNLGELIGGRRSKQSIPKFGFNRLSIMKSNGHGN